MERTALSPPWSSPAALCRDCDEARESIIVKLSSSDPVVQSLTFVANVDDGLTVRTDGVNRASAYTQDVSNKARLSSSTKKLTSRPTRSTPATSHTSPIVVNPLATTSRHACTRSPASPSPVFSFHSTAHSFSSVNSIGTVANTALADPLDWSATTMSRR